MVIECSRCRAVFSLQEGIAAAGAHFRVQCARCLAVFDVSSPPPPPAAETALSAVAAPEAVAEPPAAPAPGPTPAEASIAAAPTEHAARARWPFLLGILVVASIVGIAMQRRERARELEDKVRQGREKMLLDDSTSLEQATKLFTDAARSAPGRALPEAERAFSLLLQAAAHKDLQGRVPAAEREEEARTAARLLQQGAAAARQAITDDKDDPVALRAMALAEAVGGSAEEAAAHVEQAERMGPRDGWVLYARAAAARAAHAHERAVQALSDARQAEPRLLRAEVDLAGISLDRGDASGARELLERVLRRNPQHDRAKRMLALVPP